MLFVARRLVLPMLIAFAVMCFAVPALFRQPLSDPPGWSDLGFDVCALPCWAGITPGETPFADAFDLLVAHVPTLTTRVLVGNVQINFSASSPEQVVNGSISEQQRRVRHVQIHLELPFIQLVSRLGMPDCFSYVPDPLGTGEGIVTHWVTGRALVSALVLFQNDHMRLTTPIRSLGVSADNTICDQADRIDWIGFAAPWRYQQLQRQNPS
jgi:hypothetical protein